MRRNYIKQSHLIALLTVASVGCLVASQYINPKTEENNAVLSIDVAGMSEPTEAKTSTFLTVDKYKTTKAQKQTKMVKEIDSYSAGGTLREQTVYTEYSQMEIGLVGKGKQSGCIVYSIDADGERTKLRSCSYSYNDDGKIEQENVYPVSEDGSDEKIEYTYTAAGNVSKAQVYYTDENGTTSLASTATYQYSDAGYLVSATFTAAGDDSSIRRVSYINNTQGKPVKVTTTDDNGTIATIETRGYYDTGEIGFSKVCDSDGAVVSKTYYYYDKNGYLERTAEFKLTETNTLRLYRINLYSYYD